MIKCPSRHHVSHVPCGQTLCLLTLSLVKQAKFSRVVGIVLIFSVSIIQLKVGCILLVLFTRDINK